MCEHGLVPLKNKSSKRLPESKALDGIWQSRKHDAYASKFCRSCDALCLRCVFQVEMAISEADDSRMTMMGTRSRGGGGKEDATVQGRAGDSVGHINGKRGLAGSSLDRQMAVMLALLRHGAGP